MAAQFKPDIVKYSKDSYIIVEGKPNSGRFFIVREGTVQVFREVDSITKKEGRTVGPGEIFGVIPVMASYSYIETAVALTDVTLLAVERKQYGELIRSDPLLAMDIIRQFSRRQRFLNEMISVRMLDSSARNSPTHLFHVAGYYAKIGKHSQAAYAYRQYIDHCPDAKNLDEARKKLKSVAPSEKVTRPSYPADTMERTYPKGCLLFAEGESGRELYVIKKGSVKIIKIMNDQEVLLAVLEKGDVLGEMALLEDKPRAATAEVYQDCRVLAINQENFEQLINSQSELVTRLTGMMAERIWVTYKQLATTLIDNPVIRIYESLLIQLEKDRINLKSKKPYTCNFGYNELADMAGIPARERSDLFGKTIKSKWVHLYEDKIIIDNPSEIARQANSYRRVRRR